MCHVLSKNHTKALNKTNYTEINSSTDHLPVIAEFKCSIEREIFQKKVAKRSLKNFSSSIWKETLASRDLSKIGESQDINNNNNNLFLLSKELL